MKTNSYK